MANLKAYSQENNFEEATLIKNASTKETSDVNDCPVTTAIDVIGGKWKVIILYQLRGKTLRFGELKKIIPKITQKMLSQQLRELEKNKLGNENSKRCFILLSYFIKDFIYTLNIR